MAVLESDAGLFEKARACQQLGEFGTEDAIPTLAKLLTDEHLSAYARSGLEGIGGPKAAEVLRAAAGRVKGKLLAGMVNSLGRLRDEQAVGILSKLAQEPAAGVVSEALAALGRISSEAAIGVLKTILTKGPAESRPGAAAGCLLAAARQLSEGNAAQAQALYDAMLNAELPEVYRSGATRGAILARKSDGVAFLIKQLQAADPVVRNAALITIREISSDQLASGLNQELRRAKPELQILLLNAMADCHNRDSLAIIEAKGASEDPEIRKAALRVLGRIADPAEVEFLLKAMAINRGPEESLIALKGVERLEGATVDFLIVKALSAATDSAVRIQFIRLLDARGATNANDELLRQAAGPDAQVSIAALEALKSRAGAHELSALIALTKACQNESIRRAAEDAVYGACASSGDAGAEAVLTELKKTAKSVQKNSWVRVLSSLGYAQALPAIEPMVTDADESVAINAIDQLGQWPDPAPIEALFTAAETGAKPELRQRALASAIRLAGMAAEEHQRPDALIAGWFERAGNDSHSVTERRLIISGLGRLNHPDSLWLLSAYLNEPGLEAEAAAAILQIAPVLAKQGGGEPLRQALDKIAAGTSNNELRNQARKIAGGISGHQEVSLFEGRTLEGWEGDTNVWRVREGVILGGSMAGNPRNEFLATSRSYTNFDLRLEYKLVGTEGFINSGVQFHSVRVVQPPNEMSGYQADIGAGYSGCLYDESRRNKFLVRASDEQIKRLERPGNWNRYEVRCEGSHIQITLNGEKTVDYTETDETMAHRGLIGLQIHGGCKAEVSFRNITIQELP